VSLRRGFEGIVALSDDTTGHPAELLEAVNNMVLDLDQQRASQEEWVGRGSRKAVSVMQSNGAITATLTNMPPGVKCNAALSPINTRSTPSANNAEEMIRLPSVIRALRRLKRVT
jgi:hypothetical protein